MPDTHTEIRAEICLATQDLRADIAFFTDMLGMRMDAIWPADDPAVALVSGHGLHLRLDRDAAVAPATLRILTDDPDGFAGGARRLTAPNGTRIEVDHITPPLVVPPTLHSFAVRRLKDGAPWVVGRAGMMYRDLVPDRLGGAMIASHIRIPDGGPVPDMVHFHRIGFQLIFCIAGWVDVVYEDQGPPIRLTPGSCFIQPPQIRHRVLHASDGIEVIEIGVPADHVTEIDHTMTLPTPHLRPDRVWDGQRFVWNTPDDATWHPHRLTGFAARDTTITAHTQGVAGVLVVRPDGATPRWHEHRGDILFTYVMAGGMRLQADGHPDIAVEQGDAFVIPPGMRLRYGDPSPDLELLEVALPGRVDTREET